ncbi:MAG: 2Fe-2S iron-sulfur cluster-binding protein [Acidobacteriota bacterium]
MYGITAETATGKVSIESEGDRKLVLAIEDAGIDILHRCGGNARCTTCRVEIIEGDPGPIGDAEKTILETKTDLGDHTRLSCQIRIMDNLHVRVINQASIKGLDPGPRPVEEPTP